MTTMIRNDTLPWQACGHRHNKRNKRKTSFNWKVTTELFNFSVFSDMFSFVVEHNKEPNKIQEQCWIMHVKLPKEDDI